MEDQSISEIITRQFEETQKLQIKFISDLRRFEQSKTSDLITIFGFVLVLAALAIRIWSPGEMAVGGSNGEFLVAFFGGIALCIIGALLKMYRYNKMVITMAKEHQRLGAEMLRQVADTATLMVRQKEEYMKTAAAKPTDMKMPFLNL